MSKVYIKKEVFQRLICNFILSEDYKNVIDSTVGKDDPRFRDGFLFGLCWASMLSGDSDIWEFEEDIIREAKEEWEKETERKLKRTLEILETKPFEIPEKKDKDKDTNIFRKENHPLEDLISQPYKGTPLEVML